MAAIICLKIIFMEIEMTTVNLIHLCSLSISTFGLSIQTYFFFRIGFINMSEEKVYTTKVGILVWEKLNQNVSSQFDWKFKTQSASRRFVKFS